MCCGANMTALRVSAIDGIKVSDPSRTWHTSNNADRSSELLYKFQLIYFFNFLKLFVCHITLYYVMICYIKLYYALLYHVLLYYVMSCYDMLYYVILCYVILCYVMLCCDMLCHVMSCYAM